MHSVGRPARWLLVFAHALITLAPIQIRRRPYALEAPVDGCGGPSPLYHSPHSSLAIRAQYACERATSTLCAAVDEAKTDARRTRNHAPSTAIVPTNAPPDRPGRPAGRDRLGRLDVAPEWPGRCADEHDRGGGGRRAPDHRLPARPAPLDELPRPRMVGRPARDTCRVARVAGPGDPAAGSARTARACLHADRPERAERHAGTVAPSMRPRRLVTGRIGWA